MKTFCRVGLILFILLLIGCNQNSQQIVADVSTQSNPWTHLRVNNSADNFQFAVVSDRTGGNRPDVFAAAAEKINLLQPEFVMCVGDLIDGYTEDEKELDKQWNEFDSIVEQLEMPFFYVPGNHDITYENEVMLKIWKRRLGRSYYHFIYHDVLFLCLNSEGVLKEKDTTNLGEEQLEYFKNVLKKNSDVRWTLLFLHQPLWHENYKGDTDWQQIEMLLSDRQHTVFAGHFHTYQKSVRSGQNYYGLATTGGASGLTGPENGQFDHVVWITMTDQGPRIANLALDGIFDDNPLKAKK
jgi:3',5'-cyclic AMP phosphodiesterase CpdA